MEKGLKKEERRNQTSNFVGETSLSFCYCKIIKDPFTKFPRSKLRNFRKMIKLLHSVVVTSI